MLSQAQGGLGARACPVKLTTIPNMRMSEKESSESSECSGVWFSSVADEG